MALMEPECARDQPLFRGEVFAVETLLPAFPYRGRDGFYVNGSCRVQGVSVLQSGPIPEKTEAYRAGS